MPAVSSITNRWGHVEPVRVAAEHFTIYRGRRGAAYNHHHQITSWQGCLIATWSNGITHEDEPGQRMLCATSCDGGECWSDPKVLVSCQPGEHGYGIVTAMGIYVHRDRMMGYYGYYDYTETGLQLYRETGGCYSKRDPGVRFHQGTHTGILVSEDGGENWVGPVGKIPRVVPNLCPQRLASGRLVMPGNMCFPYTDDPYGIEGWTVSGIPGLPIGYTDDPEGFWKGKHHRGDAHSCCEGSCFRTNDGVIHMMLRTDGGVLAVVESHDDGETWSEPALTAYTDCRCRFHFGRLPDGRFFGLSCPAPGSQRTPLVLAASDDGVVFDQHYVLGDEAATGPRMLGYHKDGRYGYPTYHIADGMLYVIYSVYKEDIAMCRVPLSALAGA